MLDLLVEMASSSGLREQVGARTARRPLKNERDEEAAQLPMPRPKRIANV